MLFLKAHDINEFLKNLKHGKGTFALNIVVIGAGYVGLVTSACFAEIGHLVVCIDINEKKINTLQQGKIPIYEPGLEVLITKNITNKRLHFLNSLSEIWIEPEVIFIAVGTPSNLTGSPNMQYVLQAAKNIGERIKKYCVIVDKSTVLVGVTEEVQHIIQAELAKRQQNIAFDVVSNPEFLREGAAIEDFMRPDRIIIGTTSAKAKTILLELYLPIMRNLKKIYFMNIKDAELTKYAANAMLATRISFMNEIALLCECMDVDVENVRIGIGSDDRIGSAFIYPGCGYGGSCFPKDVKALIKMAEDHQIDPFVLRSVEKRNFYQKQLLSKKITSIFGEDLTGIIIGVWGLSFKPETDDLREASSLVLLEQLILRNAQIQAYDPVAVSRARDYFPPNWFQSGQLRLAEKQYEAVENADALVLVTEWKSFCYPDLSAMKKIMRQHIIFDGRNQYDPKQIREAQFDYYGIGR